VRPDIVVNIVNNRKDAPETVDLRVVTVDLRDHQNNRGHKQREGQAEHERVCRGVDIQQSLAAVDALDDPVRQVVKLGQVWLHSFAEVGAFWQLLDKR
jgi:hypothetical protein